VKNRKETNGLEQLAAAVGKWRGTNVLQDPHTGKADKSASTAAVTPLLGGRFVRLDYTWRWGGKPQEGSLLLGFDGEAEKLRGYWIDSWHQSARALLCEGPRPSGGQLSVRGSYPAPPGPDWGWRIAVARKPRGLKMTMFNVTPDGQEEVAVEAAWTPPAAAGSAARRRSR
jgi:hypothetical protein